MTDVAEMTPEERVADLTDQLGEAAGRVYDLEERLASVDRMLDERGWHQLFSHDLADGGLTLKQIRLASNQLRELVAANVMLKRALRARTTYVWGGGVEYAGWLANGSPTSLTNAVKTKITSTRFQRLLFGNVARAELESAAFTDGNLFLLFGGQAEVQRVLMDQITADMRDPDDQETIWMFRRQWSVGPSSSNPGQRQQKTMWYYTDAFPGTRQANVQLQDGKTEPIDRARTMVHVPFNGQVGWAYGIPDALPVVAWVRLYREFITNGYVMSRALAQIAFKMSSSTAAGGSRLAAEVSMPGQAGNAVSMGAGQDMSALSTAGKGYDFASGDGLASMIAAGIEVSVDTLLAKGNQTELDMDTRAAAELRRLEWDDAFDRILRQMGSTRPLRATWRNLPIEQIQRQMQAWTLARNSGTLAGEKIQRGIADTLRISDPGPLPAYYDTLLQGTDTGATSGTADVNGKGGTTGAGGATDGTGQGQGNGNPTGNQDTSGQGETTTN